MSAVVSGECILFNPEPVALLDKSDNSYRFFYTYHSYIPVDHLGTIDETAIESDKSGKHNFICQLWIAVPSPATPFPDKSLVYYRGRLIVPPCSANDQLNPTITIYIECIYTQFRRSVPCIYWSREMLIEAVRPETTVIGKVKKIWPAPNSSQYILIEMRENVGTDVEIMFIWYVCLHFVSLIISYHQLLL